MEEDRLRLAGHREAMDFLNKEDKEDRETHQILQYLSSNPQRLTTLPGDQYCTSGSWYIFNFITKQLFSGTDNALNAVTRIGWDSQWCDLVWGTRLWRGFCSIQDLYLLLVLEKESRDAYLSLFHFPSLFPSLCVDCHLNMTHVKYIYVKLWQAV